MRAVRELHLVSVDDYLAGELVSPIKHEYLGGRVYAMVGPGNAHNLIATNAIGALGARLRGHRCRPYNSDTKIRIRLPTHVRFYYPDLSLICSSNSPNDSFQDYPLALIEVLSRATRRTDQVEKRDAYLAIPSLAVYLMVEQEFPGVVALRRTDTGFAREVYAGLDAVIPLPEVKAELPLAEIYEGVEFVPEAPEAEEPIRA